MGESAKILNPDKKVVMPDPSADCAMAHMASGDKIAELRRTYPDLAVVCYINSTAQLKAMSDVCVTSSNAAAIVSKLPQKNIFFIPDKNLGRHVAEQVPQKNVILNEGCCPVHAAISPAELARAKEAHPGAEVLSHPECEAEILAASDFIGSTADIIAYAKKSDAKEFIICTEDGVEWKLSADGPDKAFYFPATRPCCPDMKQNTLKALLAVLEKEHNEITVDPALAAAARIPLDRMLELAK